MKDLDRDWINDMARRIPFLKNHGYCQECQEDFDWATCPHFGYKALLLKGEVDSLKGKIQSIENRSSIELTDDKGETYNSLNKLEGEKSKLTKEWNNAKEIQTKFMLPSRDQANQNLESGAEHAESYLQCYREYVLFPYLDNYEFIESNGKLGIYINTHRHCVPYDYSTKEYSEEEDWTVSIPVFPVELPLDERYKIVDHCFYFLSKLSERIPVSDRLTLFVTNGSSPIATLAFMNGYEYFLGMKLSENIDINWEIVQYTQTKNFGTTYHQKSERKRPEKIGYQADIPMVNTFIKEIKRLRSIIDNGKN